MNSIGSAPPDHSVAPRHPFAGALPIESVSLTANDFRDNSAPIKILCCGLPRRNFPNAARPHFDESIARRSPTSISLAFPALQSNSCDRGNHRRGKNMTTITEQTETAPETKATKKASRGARRANVRPAIGKAAKKATPKKKAPKNARNGSKTATILELLQRQCGATTKELLKATNWRPHSLRFRRS
jgi:hypothetical protein